MKKSVKPMASIRRKTMPTKTMLKGVMLSVLSVAMLAGCSTFKRSEPNRAYGVAATDRTVAQRLLDRSIETTARLNINSLDENLPKISRIGIDSFYSSVLLTGEVPNQMIKEDIVNIVSSMPDVKKVHDGINVMPKKGMSYTVHDGYITSKLNTKILADDLINATQIKVVTDDGIVYILGKLTPTQRGHLMNIVENTTGIKELVLLTDLIDDNGNIIDEGLVSQEAGLESPSNSGYYASSTNYSVRAPVTTNASIAANSNQAIVEPKVATVVPLSNVPYSTNNPNPSNTDTNSEYIEMYQDNVPNWE